MLAPPVYIDGWATPWYRGLRPLLYLVPGIGRTMKIEEEDPFGIKNEQLRAIVKAKFERGENFHYRWVPLECLRQVDRLRGIVMKHAKEIRCPTLVVHARRGRAHEPALRQFPGRADRRRARADGRAGGQLPHDLRRQRPRDRRQERARVLRRGDAGRDVGARQRAAGCRAKRWSRRWPRRSTKLAAGDFSGLRELAIPDLAWVQPGVNKMSGAHMGKTFAAFASRITQGHAPRFTAFGTPVFNRGVALVPATLVAAREEQTLESQGALLLAYHGGKLLEARWFADDVEREDAFFGEPEPEVAGAASLDADFDAAATTSKTLRKAPDNDTLLALYSLYKQATVGDVSGDRPGALDMINRAKFDAWTARKGTAREDAMKAYIELVTKLKEAERLSPGSSGAVVACGQWADRLKTTRGNPHNERSNSQRYDVAAVSCGRDQTLALLASGKVIGWGGDGSGRIPSGDPEYCTTPAPTRAVEVLLREPLAAVTAGAGVSLGITARREVTIWGAHGAGVDGRVGAVAAATPLRVQALSGVRAVAAGEFQCAAVDESGAVFTWGVNLDGALGRPATELESPPGRVPGLPRCAASRSAWATCWR